MVSLKWFGQSMWQIKTESTTIIIDPFAEIGYTMPEDLGADVVISSHPHDDHANFSLVKEPFTKITELGVYQVNDVSIQLLQSSHGTLNGQSLGHNYMSLIKAEGLSILHCGDIQVMPDEKQLSNITDLDIVMVPVGGVYTFNAEQAKSFIEAIKPKITIPMHYKTDRLMIDIETFDSFSKLYPNIENLGSAVLNIQKADITDKRRIIKMNYA